MRSLEYFKKPYGELGKEWPEATTRTLRELCQQKIEWTPNDAGVTDRSRIISNIDETCYKMLLMLKRGWLARGEQHVVMDTRRNITAFLATRHLVPDVCAQPTFQGKTSAVESANHCPRAHHVPFREPLDDDDNPMNVFTTMSRCVCEQTIASSLVATCCDPHECCVDEHIGDSCDCVSDFQMEVVSTGKGVRKHG